VAIPGLGGVGGAHLEVLARQGIGRFKLADFDTFELANFNRQFGATMDTIGRPKLDVIAERARAIDPEAVIEAFPDGVRTGDIDRFLHGVDVVVDSLDAFAVQIRRELFAAAYARGIPVVTAGPMGWSAALQVIAPPGPSFDRFYGFRDGMDETELLARFLHGVAPRGLHFSYIDANEISVLERRGPSSAIGISLCAAAAGMEVVRIVLGWGDVRTLPWHAQLDLKTRQWVWRRDRLGLRGPAARVRVALLKRRLETRTRQERARRAADPIDAVLRDACLAPSAENTQPWRVIRRLDDRVCVEVDPARAGLDLDPSGRLATLAVGAFVESLEIAAPRHGLTPRFDVVPGERWPAVEVGFAPAPARPHRLDWALHARWTNRFPYETAPISSELTDQLTDASRRFDGIELAVVADDAVPGVARILSTFDEIRMSSVRENAALLAQLRTDDEEAKQRDGIRLRATGVGKLLQLGLLAAQRLHAPGLLVPGARKAAADIARTVARSGAIVLLHARPGTSTLEAGRAMQRVWLEATLAGLATQPMYAAVHFSRLAHRGDLEPPQRERVLRAQAELRRRFSVEHDREWITLFRLGHSRRPRIASARRDPAG
jgi:nitroreductase